MPRFWHFLHNFILYPPLTTESRRIVNLLPPHDSRDDRTIIHDWTCELDQDGALHPFTWTGQSSHMLDLGAFAPVVLREQLSRNVSHRLRSNFIDLTGIWYTTTPHDGV
jgi:hypothetical protein